MTTTPDGAPRVSAGRAIADGLFDVVRPVIQFIDRVAKSDRRKPHGNLAVPRG